MFSQDTVACLKLWVVWKLCQSINNPFGQAAREFLKVIVDQIFEEPHTNRAQRICSHWVTEKRPANSYLHYQIDLVRSTHPHNQSVCNTVTVHEVLKQSSGCRTVCVHRITSQKVDPSPAMPWSRSLGERLTHVQYNLPQNMRHGIRIFACTRLVIIQHIHAGIPDGRFQHIVWDF